MKLTLPRLPFPVIPFLMVTAWILIMVLTACDDKDARKILSVSDTLGIAGGISGGEDPQDQCQREVRLQINEDIGIRYIRTGFGWSSIEKERGTFDFEAYDRKVDRAARYRQELIGVLLYGNPWATQKTTNDNKFPPDDPADFGRYVYETVRHFRGSVRLWEVWNEPNVGWRFWKPKPDPGAYGDLLKAAYVSAKDADPGCVVAFGGLAPIDFYLKTAAEFTEDIYEIHPDLSDYYDVMAIHTYTFMQTLSPEDTSANPNQGSLVQMIREARDLMEKHGASDRPIWITEMGWPTYGNGVEPYGYGVLYRTQAQYLVRSYILSLSEGIEKICWYTFSDGRGKPFAEGELYFGLVEYVPDYCNPAPPIQKPSYQAHKIMYRQIGDTYFERDLRGELELKDNEYGFLFDNPEKSVMVLWNAGEGETSEVKILGSFEERALQTGNIKMVRMLGGKKNIEPANNSITVQISNDPIYIVRFK